MRNPNHILRIVLAVLFFISSSLMMSAQNDNDPSKFLPNIIPPSPTAYALGNYGNTPIGLFTGSQNITIPLYTYKTSNIEVPITMFYSSNGIKVDEVSSNVGTSWNLNYGGIISRVVRDKPDEDRGNFPIPFSIADSVSISSPEALEFFQYIGESDVDTEADLFSFNFGKYSGKFIFDNHRGIIMMPAQMFKIECIPAEGIFNFLVTTPDGVKYYFNDKEVTNQKVVGGGHSIPTLSVSSWYLSKIVHPKGDEIVFTYDDISTQYISSKSQSFRIPFPHFQYDVYGVLLNPSGNLSAIYDNTLTISGKAIKSIKSTNLSYGEVIFTYLSNSSADVEFGNNKLSQITIKDKSSIEINKINFNYTTTANNRVFLDKIQFKDLNQNYQFEYLNRDDFPQRLSFSQDHWGYFNGKANTSIVPANIDDYDLANTNYNGANKELDGNFARKGLLSKITYPTKGYTTFDYESNDYYGEKKIYPEKVYKTLEAITPEGETNATAHAEYDLSVQTKQNIEIFGSVNFNCSDQGLNINKNKATYKVYNVTKGQYMTLFSYSTGGELVNYGSSFQITPNMDVSTRTHFFIADPNDIYKISLDAMWSCTKANITFNYYPTAISSINTNISTGGIRVKQTNDYSSSQSNPIVKRYFYAKRDELSKSSGNKGFDPYYIDFTESETLRDDGGPYYLIDHFTYLNLSSSSIVSLFDTGNSNVFYEFVTISIGDNTFSGGGEEHQFIVNRDKPGRILIGNYDMRSSPLTNFGWDNGLLKKVSFINKNFNVVKETVNVYEERTDLRREAVSYSSRKQFEKVATAPVVRECTVDDTNQFYTFLRCITDHKHVAGGSLVRALGIADTDYACIAPGANNVVTYYYNPCYNKTLPAQVSYPDNINNISVLSYKNISYWHYLKSTVDKQYDINGLNPITTTTTYDYGNPNHLQLTSQSVTNSKGETLETKYFYSKDPEMANKPFVSELNNKNIIGTPLDTQIYKAGVKQSEQLTVYDKSVSTSDLLLPKFIYAAKFPNILPDISTIGNLEKKITFDQYDDKGNIQQYTLENGTPVSIIWGYNKTQPIAKVENASYSDISSYVNNLQNISDTGTEADLLLALGSLRSSLPNNMITTYTYKLLIGISSITDPKGFTTYYEYDAYNRLKLVKDNQGKILTENQYHYKN